MSELKRKRESSRVKVHLNRSQSRQVYKHSRVVESSKNFSLPFEEVRKKELREAGKIENRVKTSVYMN